MHWPQIIKDESIPTIGDVTSYRPIDYWLKRISALILYDHCIHNWREPEEVNTVFTRGEVFEHLETNSHLLTNMDDYRGYVRAAKTWPDGRVTYIWIKSVNL